MFKNSLRVQSLKGTKIDDFFPVWWDMNRIASKDKSKDAWKMLIKDQMLEPFIKDFESIYKDNTELKRVYNKSNFVKLILK